MSTKENDRPIAHKQFSNAGEKSDLLSKTPLDSSVLTSRSSSFYANLSKRVKSKTVSASKENELSHKNLENIQQIKKKDGLNERVANVNQSDLILHQVNQSSKSGNKIVSKSGELMRKLNPEDDLGRKLLTGVLWDPNNLSAWKTFLDHVQHVSPPYSKKQVSDWYDRAIDMLPPAELRKDDVYIEIALNWASMSIEEDTREAKTRFKWIVANRIGLQSAAMYVARARLEFEISGLMKAKKVLEEGLSRGAEPSSIILNEMTNLSEKRKFEQRFNDSILSDLDISVRSITSEMVKSAHPSYPHSETENHPPLHSGRTSESARQIHMETDAHLSKRSLPANSISESLKKLLFEDSEDEEKPGVSLSGHHHISSTSKTTRNISLVDAVASTDEQKLALTPGSREFNQPKIPARSKISPQSFESRESGGSETPKVSAAGSTPRRPKVRFTGQNCSQELSLNRAVEPGARDTEKNPPQALPPNTSQVFEINGRIFHRLEVVGKGGSGKVYKVIGEDLKIYALKKVRFNPDDSRAVEGFKNEIKLLRLLRTKPNIIHMYDCSEDYESGTLLMLFEFGEIDLAKTLKKRDGKAMNINYIKTLWQQMLEAVQTIHEARIVHGDLKPANFIFVSGDLKLIDFGIAKALQNDTTHIERDTQIGTVNYMSPEAILSSENDSNSSSDKYKLTRASDIWSLGCILYQMVYGKTPFHHIQKTVLKLCAIADPSFPIPFESCDDMTVVDVLKRCLERNPHCRPTIPQLLEHQFLRSGLKSGSNQVMLEVDRVQKFLVELQKKGVLASDIDHETLSKSLKSAIARTLGELGENLDPKLIFKKSITRICCIMHY